MAKINNFTDLSAQVRQSSDFNKPLFDNQLLNYKQTAQYLSLSEPYLRKLKARGELPFVIVGGRAVRFRVSSLNRWIEEREIINEQET